jgi:hypothetical protein
MRAMILVFAAGLTLACSGAEPSAPFQSQSGRPPVVRPTTLDVRFSAVTNIIAPVSLQHTNGKARTLTLALPIRIENRSQQVITARIAHEWYGGEWPQTDLGAAVKKSEDASEEWRASEVYLVGELGGRTEPNVWQPGQSHDFLIRMNWRGTASVYGMPLIENDAPGKYAVKLSLVFKTGADTEYVKSQQIEITVRDK